MQQISGERLQDHWSSCLVCNYRKAFFTSSDQSQYTRWSCQKLNAVNCKLNAVEDEVHFLCNCSAYQTLRQRLLVLLSTKFLLLGYSMTWQNLYGS